MSESEDTTQPEEGWIPWFLNLEDHSFFLKIDHDFIRDPSNLYGLKSLFPHFPQALNMILDPDTPEDDDLEDPRFLEIY